MKLISKSVLAQHDGNRGSSKWVAFRGVVYDVSNCPKWQSDLHEQIHFPGQDLSPALSEAPHGPEVFGYPCVKRVGILEND